MNTKERKRTLYEKYIKRMLDILCSICALILLCWLYGILALAVRIRAGKPVIFTQKRPGKDEKIFSMYKFRTMTDERDANGRLLPDEARLTRLGRWMRDKSLDELPEMINILKGEMSFVGPRPLLVRDMTFMTEEQRRRHCVRPGLTGLAQTSGRNALPWDQKLSCDLEYIQNVTFANDLKIIWKTVQQVLFHEKALGDTEIDEVAITDDLGDYLLKRGRVTKEEYDRKQAEAVQLLRDAK